MSIGLLYIDCSCNPVNYYFLKSYLITENPQMWMCSINVCIYFNYYYLYYFLMRLTRRAEGHRYQSFGHYLNDILDNERNENIYLIEQTLSLKSINHER